MLTEAEATELGSQAGRRKTAPALAPRARIILACGEGLQNKDIAARLGVHAMTVGKWRRRFLSQRIDGLHHEPRTGSRMRGSRRSSSRHWNRNPKAFQWIKSADDIPGAIERRCVRTVQTVAQ